MSEQERKQKQKSPANPTSITNKDDELSEEQMAQVTGGAGKAAGPTESLTLNYTKIQN